MVSIISGINVWSDMNSWIEFIVVPTIHINFDKAKDIVNDAYDSYWEDESANDETMVDWVRSKLDKEGIEYDIYFMETEDDEEN